MIHVKAQIVTGIVDLCLKILIRYIGVRAAKASQLRFYQESSQSQTNYCLQV